MGFVFGARRALFAVAPIVICTAGNARAVEPPPAPRLSVAFLGLYAVQPELAPVLAAAEERLGRGLAEAEIAFVGAKQVRSLVGSEAARAALVECTGDGSQCEVPEPLRGYAVILGGSLSRSANGAVARLEARGGDGRRIDEVELVARNAIELLDELQRAAFLPRLASKSGRSFQAPPPWMTLGLATTSVGLAVTGVGAVFVGSAFNAYQTLITGVPGTVTNAFAAARTGAQAQVLGPVLVGAGAAIIAAGSWMVFRAADPPRVALTFLPTGTGAAVNLTVVLP